MIPTSFKRKLPKELSWPLGAQAISEGLTDAPHIDELTLVFRSFERVSEFHSMLAGLTPYPILIARYNPPQHLGYSAARDMIEKGWYDAKWELEVRPVVRRVRAASGSALREVGLPAVAEWLKTSAQTGWEDHRHALRLVFDPTESKVTQEIEEGI
jgi:hypothetical protein